MNTTTATARTAVTPLGGRYVSTTAPAPATVGTYVGSLAVDVAPGSYVSTPARRDLSIGRYTAGALRRLSVATASVRTATGSIHTATGSIRTA